MPKELVPETISELNAQDAVLQVVGERLFTV